MTKQRILWGSLSLININKGVNKKNRFSTQKQKSSGTRNLGNNNKQLLATLYNIAWPFFEYSTFIIDFWLLVFCAEKDLQAETLTLHAWFSVYARILLWYKTVCIKLNINFITEIGAIAIIIDHDRKPDKEVMESKTAFPNKPFFGVSPCIVYDDTKKVYKL